MRLELCLRDPAAPSDAERKVMAFYPIGYAQFKTMEAPSAAIFMPLGILPMQGGVSMNAIGVLNTADVERISRRRKRSIPAGPARAGSGPGAALEPQRPAGVPGGRPQPIAQLSR